MASFTMTLAEIVQNQIDLGLRKYPIFDETYRRPLNKKFLHVFWTREINFETVNLFKFKLNTAFELVMPYYNQLYKSTLLEFNPLYNKDINITDNKTSKATGSVNQTGEGNGLSVGSDTPQSMIAIGDLKSNTYASNATMDETSSSQNSTSEADTTEAYTSHIIGMDGAQSSSQKILEFRKTFLNIDKMLFEDEEIQNLFMKVYNI